MSVTDHLLNNNRLSLTPSVINLPMHKSECFLDCALVFVTTQRFTWTAWKTLFGMPLDYYRRENSAYVWIIAHANRHKSSIYLFTRYYLSFACEAFLRELDLLLGLINSVYNLNTENNELVTNSARKPRDLLRNSVKKTKRKDWLIWFDSFVLYGLWTLCWISKTLKYFQNDFR